MALLKNKAMELFVDYRSLLQKSHIKETVFCKRDALFKNKTVFSRQEIGLISHGSFQTRTNFFFFSKELHQTYGSFSYGVADISRLLKL